jgi:hypothetical protein
MKVKAKVWFFSFVNDAVKIVAKRKFKISSKKVSYEKKSYLLDTTKGVELKKSKFIYFVDILQGQVYLSKNEVINVMSAEVLDEFVSTNIIKQMIAAVKPSGWTEKIILLVLGVMAGCGLGFTLAGYF